MVGTKYWDLSVCWEENNAKTKLLISWWMFVACGVWIHQLDVLGQIFSNSGAEQKLVQNGRFFGKFMSLEIFCFVLPLSQES